MPSPISERRLVDVLISWLRKRYIVAREAPHFEKRIDLALLNEDEDESWAIEAKTTNWPRAIQQALLNLPVARRSYIAVYSQHIHRVDISSLQEHRLGLISVGSKWGEVEIIRKAPVSPYYSSTIGGRLIEYINKEGSNGSTS